FLELPHQEITRLSGVVGDTTFDLADFSTVTTRCKFVALMPQWDFLNFLAEQARRYPTFHLRMNSEVTDLLFEDERVIGVRVQTEDAEVDILADLIVGSDGRHSVVREHAGFAVLDVGAPIDVLWMRIARRPDDPSAGVLGRINFGKMVVLL